MDTSKAIEIKVALMRIGKTQAAIARELNVTTPSVNDVIHGKKTSKRISTYIDEIIKKRPENVFSRHTPKDKIANRQKTLKTL